MEPKSANVTGEKIEREVQKHVFEHRIHWGYVALGAAVVVVVWFLSREFADGPKNQDTPPGMEV